MQNEYEHDIFISHASEDKDDFVRPLAQKLKEKGYRVWYDEFSLVIGDSLSISIDKGLSESRFGIIVLSQHFINKSWTQRELQGMVQKEINSGKVILPIWHRITHTEVRKFSPTLADKLASDSTQGFPKVVNDIEAALKKAGITGQQLPTDTIKPNPRDLSVFQFETVKLYAENNDIRSVTSTYQAKYFAEDLGFGVKLEMIEIPGGTFLMGSFENEEKNRGTEHPRHQVTVPSFFIGKYAITQEQWEKVANSFPKINRDLDPRPSHFKRDDHRPVEKVSWYDAVEFCVRLSQKTGRDYRLPSEAEWEYACRAGTTTPFYFGETTTDKVANYNANYIYGKGIKGNYRQQTMPVGSFPPNGFGLYDMHGNVWEWCLDDWHSDYAGAPIDGSHWFDDNNNYSQKQGKAVLRGGSWDFHPVLCRSASRNDFGGRRGYRNYNIGFRVVCAAGWICQ
ncbi:SUMF1/EgtB/PvdO family nonheme iron enzyme [Calothrix sp. PCC 7507]|uniref:SUMF1/EgtB/PvdO family nonheme iron enzyme n=1 Tax=Calothrix sp. PCC 7507 TaxID=99598 RepID=UPI00029F0DCD|nr:Sulphatase-modifying factor protein [Calothrix sp. PCC 7507]